MDQRFGGLHLLQKDNVYVLHMNNGENTFNADSVANLHKALDTVESTTGPCALIFVGEGKFFSTGLDLKWLGSRPKSAFPEFLRQFQKLLARVLSLPFPTIAALNGHAYAGGAIFSLACDWRIMRSDRGFWCLPEIDIHMPLTAGLNAIIAAKLPSPKVYRDAVILAKKYGGNEAKKAGIVDESVAEDAVLTNALELGKSVAPKGEDRGVYGAIKREWMADTIQKLIQESLGEGGAFLSAKL
eukprot:Phypoly_transcript_14388.p1 GENE.Phypoly_transcript_14388~~Phypoly_transcript_14388.p1  ORF type:complete len:262 (+),score=32.13 Phypoly_transcript_14388:63-788(+)